MQYFWQPFATRLRSFLDAAPEPPTVIAGFMTVAEHERLYHEARRVNPQAAERIGLPEQSPFLRGRAAVLEYPSKEVEKWALRNGPKYGVHVDKDMPWMVRPLGDRFKGPGAAKPLSATDMLEVAVGDRFYHENPEAKYALPEQGVSGGTPGQVNPATPLDTQTIAMRMVRQHEGFSNTVYEDPSPEKNPTIGIGHLITEEDRRAGLYSEGTVLSDEEVEALFVEDYNYHRRGAEALENWDELSPHLQAGLIDFVFNTGIHTFGFGEEDYGVAWPKMKAAIESRDWEAAAAEVDKDWDNVGATRRNRLIGILLEEVE